MSFLIHIAGALRRFARPLLRSIVARSPRGWKLALAIAMLVLPGGSLAAIGFAWYDQRRQRAREGDAGGDEPSSWPLALPAPLNPMNALNHRPAAH